jgi:hypothetical protein
MKGVRVVSCQESFYLIGTGAVLFSGHMEMLIIIFEVNRTQVNSKQRKIRKCPEMSYFGHFLKNASLQICNTHIKRFFPSE